MSSKMSGERRWTLRHGIIISKGGKHSYTKALHAIDGPALAFAEEVRVMPVSEHEQLRKVAQCLVDVWRHTDSETEVHDEIHRLADVLRHPEERR